jgi:ATP-binding cassette subfamily B protein
MKRLNRSALSFVYRYTKKYWYFILIGFVATIASNLLQVFVPLLVGKTIDFISATTNGEAYQVPQLIADMLPPDASPTTTLLYLGLSLAAVALVFALIQGLMRIVILAISRHVDYDMRNDFVAHLQKMSQRFFQEYKTGDLMARATNDIPAIRQLTSRGFMHIFNTTTILLFALIFMFKIDVTLTLIALSPFPFLTIVMIYFMEKMHKAYERIQDQFSKLMSHVQENLSGMRVIKSYVREKFEIESFKKENEKYIDRNIKGAKVDIIFDAWLELFISLSFIAMLWVGGVMVIRKAMTVGQLVTFIGYVGMITWPMMAVGYLVNLLQRGLAAAERVEKIFKTPVDVLDTAATDFSISDISGSIEFDNVSFTYPGTDEVILPNLSLSIESGKKLAIIGATGSGKSTLVHLLPRLLEPTSGAIKIGGHDIQKIPLTLLRQSIGFVQQESFLFSDTLAENISFGLPDATDSSIITAAETSQLQLDVDQFPNGLETIIGERGITLSGGQKQRAAIARAVIKNPKILILDDSLSAVDTYTEEEILNRIRPIMKERTTIIVAHRISTIRDADHIIVLADGQIAEQGRHDELLAKHGLYFEMNERQQLENNLKEME